MTKETRRPTQCRPVGARVRYVLQRRDAHTADLAPGWHRAAVVAVDATQTGDVTQTGRRDRGCRVDALRFRRELVLENAVLRHQVNVLRRRSTRPKLHLIDRLKLLVGARCLPSLRHSAMVWARPPPRGLNAFLTTHGQRRSRTSVLP